MAEQRPPRVFISYSHDSEEHAARVLRLANDLRHDGIEAIIDQYFTSPPEGWPRWMDTHVRDDDFVVMVCTETYYRRVIGKVKPGVGLGVRWEGSLIYNHIYESDLTRFVPVLTEGGKRANIPEPVRGSSYYLVDTSGGYDGLLRRLFGRPAAEMPPLCERSALPVLSSQWRERPLGRLYNVPDLPPNFVSRPGDIALVKALLMSDAGATVGIIGGARRAGLLGMGGIGKTVLATALAHDEQIRERFPDGLFWLSFGREAKVTDLQAELARLLGDSAASFETWQDGRSRLSELTADRTALVVLDDLWGFVHAEAFTRLGPGMGLVVTTRDQGVLEKVGAPAHRLDLLSQDAARALLRESADLPADAPTPAPADEIVRECGFLPLAISVIGALIRSGRFEWARALARLKAADIKRLRAKLPEYETESVLAALQVSVDELPERERQVFHLCAVLPEDLAVPEAALVTLWSKIYADEEDAGDAAQLFVDRSLLSRDEARRYRLHDLYHDYLRAECSDLPAAHTRFVEAYRKRCPDGWASGPNDGYFFQFLPHHLAAAGRLDELKALLADYAWIEAKLKATDAPSLISDYDLAVNEPDLSLVQRALRLSVPALSRGWTHLPGQLIGRLREINEPRIRMLLEKASAGPGTAWLCPHTASLLPPGPLLQTFTGHTEGIAALAVLPDGRVVSGSYDETLRVWNADSGASQVLVGHSGPVMALAVLPDGRVVSGSYDKTLRVWNADSGASQVLVGHSGPVIALVALPDGRVVSGSHDKTLRVWDVTTGASRVLKGHTDILTELAVLPDGRVVSGSVDKTLRVWDVTTGASRVLKGHSGSVIALAVLPDGRVVSSSGIWDGTLRVWNVDSGASRVLEGHTGSMSALAVLPDGRVVFSSNVVSSSQGPALRVLDVDSGASQTLGSRVHHIVVLAVLPDGRVVSGSHDKTLQVWNADSGASRVLEGHTASVSALAVLPDGRVISMSWDSLRVWDVDSGASWVLKGHTGQVEALVALPDGRVVSGSEDKTLRVWDVTTGASRVLEGHTDSVSALAVLPDGRVVSGSYDETLRVWNVDSGASQTLRVLPWRVLPWVPRVLPWVPRMLEACIKMSRMGVLGVRREGVRALAVLPDGRVVSGTQNHTLQLWNVDNGASQTLRVLKRHAQYVAALAVLPDGRVISMSWDSLRVWDVDSGASRVLEGHTASVSALAVLPDGRVVSGSADKTLRVWDVTTGASRVLEGHTDSVSALAVLPDGRVVSGSDDGTIILWDLETAHSMSAFVGDAAITACAAAHVDRLAAGSKNGVVHILRIVTASPGTNSKTRAKANAKIN